MSLDELHADVKAMIAEIELRGFNVDLFDDMRGTAFTFRAIKPMGPSIVVRQGKVRL